MINKKCVLKSNSVSILNQSFARQKDRNKLSNPAVDEFLFKRMMPQVQNEFIPVGFSLQPTRFVFTKQFT